MTEDNLEQLEIQLNRFNRLMGELMRGSFARNAFLPWELDILMDMDTCQLDRRRRVDILRQYQRAVGRQMEAGSGPPMKLSQFLEDKARRKAAVN